VQKATLEYIRCLPNDDRPMGIHLGLRPYLSLPQEYRRLERRKTNGRPSRLPDLDADEQVPEVAGPLRPASGRLSATASVSTLWLFTWPDQG